MLAAPHISTGDLLRAEIEADSPTGQQARAFVESGELVPDPLMLEMLTHRLSQADVLERGFVLDGFPRTVDQAHILGVLLAPETLDVVVELLVPESEAAQRLVARLVCPHCGRAIRGERRSGMPIRGKGSVTAGHRAQREIVGLRQSRGCPTSQPALWSCATILM